jgi:hypothetical protein
VFSALLRALSVFVVVLRGWGHVCSFLEMGGGGRQAGRQAAGKVRFGMGNDLIT